ncbi:hypothetical protein Tco_0586860 [Tanacetum coccineum]
MLNHQKALNQKNKSQAHPKAPSLSQNNLVSLRQAERTLFETTDSEMPQNQGSDLGNTDYQSNFEAALKHDWFNKPERPSTLYSDWNATKTIDFRPPHTWISKITKAEKPPLTFNGLISSPINFSAYEYPFDLSKPLPLIEDRGRQVVPINYFINNDLEYLKGGSSSRKYTTSITKTKAGKYDDIQGIEDMKKLSNLERDVIFELNVALRMFTRHVVILKRVEGLQLGVESYQKMLNITKPGTFKSDISKRTPYTAYSNPQGIIYVDKYKRNRMDYLPKRRWSTLDKQRSCIMIKANDKLQLERRLMRNLEKFVGGREYGKDFRLL